MKITIDAPTSEPYDIALPVYTSALFDHARGRVTIEIPDELAPLEGEGEDAWTARLEPLFAAAPGRYQVRGLVLGAEVPAVKPKAIETAERAAPTGAPVRAAWVEAAGAWELPKA